MRTKHRWFRGAPTLMVFLATCLVAAGNSMAQEKSILKSRASLGFRASLGIETQAPTAKLAEEVGIEPILRIRPQQWRGRIIRSIVAESPADKAGLKVGDAILEIAGNTLVSQDDFNDYLGVCKPEDEISLLVKRTNEKPATITVKLGKKPLSDGDSANRMTWNYAGLAQLRLALEEAAEKKRIVMVGLSGAET